MFFFFFSEGGLRKRWVRRWTTVKWFTSPRWMSVLCVSNCLSCSARRAQCAPRKELHVQMRFALQVWSLIYGDCGVAATQLPSVWFCLPSFCVALREVVKEVFFFSRWVLCSVLLLWIFCRCAATVKNLLTRPVHDLHPLLYGRPQTKSLYRKSHWMPHWTLCTWNRLQTWLMRCLLKVW